MKVSGSGPAPGAASTRRNERGDKRGGFARHLEGGVDAAPEALPMESSSPLAAVDAMLAAQSVNDAADQETRRRVIRRADDILDRLEDIRLGLLGGGLSRDRLIELARIIRNRRESMADPRLAAILDEIELRAEVELAKYARTS